MNTPTFFFFTSEHLSHLSYHFVNVKKKCVCVCVVLFHISCPVLQKGA